jgi:hypothetical protein
VARPFILNRKSDEGQGLVSELDGTLFMETIFLIYMLYAVVILIWSSLSPSDFVLRHLVISVALLKEGAVLGKNPIVIELHAIQPESRRVADIPGSLVVSRAELSSLIRWTPPGATLVFYEHGKGRRLDPKVEQTLLELGISAVYWLDLHYEPMHASVEARAPSRVLRPSVSISKRRRLP